MGDRANIRVKFNGWDKYQGEIYLYSHWGGTDLWKTLQDALKRGKPRWKDESYLCRIIFSEMIKDNIMDETSYGISPYMTDNEYPLLIVDIKNQAVFVQKVEWENDDYKFNEIERTAHSFDAYLQLIKDPRQLEEVSQKEKVK